MFDMPEFRRELKLGNYFMIIKFRKKSGLDHYRWMCPVTVLLQKIMYLLLSSSESAKEFIVDLLEANDYGIRNMMMPLDDFRLFLTPPGFDVESEEIFKLKGFDTVNCAAQIIMGGKIRDTFYLQDEQTRTKFRSLIENAPGVKSLDFFDVLDDGKDFVVSIRAEFPIDKLSEDVFADAMDRLNLAGGSIEDLFNEYFDKLL